LFVTAFFCIVAYSGGDFVVVSKTPTPKSHEGDLIQYIRNGKEMAIPVEQFLKTWSGIVLLAETTPNSIEPDYKEHRKKEIFNIAQKIIIALAGLLILGIAYFSNSLFSNTGLTVLIAINLSRGNGVENIRQEINSIKANEEVFKALLQKQPFYEVSKTDSQILFGNPDVEAEFQKHEAWKEKTQLRATPTILVNGYKLPDSYKIEDLKYFTEFNVNVR